MTFHHRMQLKFNQVDTHIHSLFFHSSHLSCADKSLLKYYTTPYHIIMPLCFYCIIQNKNRDMLPPLFSLVNRITNWEKENSWSRWNIDPDGHKRSWKKVWSVVKWASGFFNRPPGIYLPKKKKSYSVCDSYVMISGEWHEQGLSWDIDVLHLWSQQALGVLLGKCDLNLPQQLEGHCFAFFQVSLSILQLQDIISKVSQFSFH